MSRFTNNTNSITAVEKIKEIIKTLDNTDESIRVLAELLSDSIIRQWEEMGIKHKEGYGQISQVLFTKPGSGIYKLDCY